MKTAKFTLMFLACSAALPALAQNASPECVIANFDQSQRAFTVVNASSDTVNQQCFLTVVPSGSRSQTGAPSFVEGSYLVELSGGGGGGGGGSSIGNRGYHAGYHGGYHSGQRSSEWHGGGGGGASAATTRTVQYLSPGVYKLTIGTGGDGGAANGGLTEDGNPTSVTNASTGQLVAGFPNADVWRQGVRSADSGQGGIAYAGAASGQDGQVRASDQVAAGGGGGAGMGYGAGGTGGRGDINTAQSGGRGAHGFIRLAMQTAAAPAQEPTGAVGQGSVTPQPVERVFQPAKKARN